MGPSGFLVIIESQAIMVSTRVAIGKLIHALEVWSDDPRLPNIEPLQHEPSTADSTAIQRCIGQYSALALCPRGVVLYCNTALYILQLYSALHSTALYNPPQWKDCLLSAQGQGRTHQSSLDHSARIQLLRISQHLGTPSPKPLWRATTDVRPG